MVWLEAGTDFSTVDCKFGVTQEDRIKQLKPGQTVTIKGEIRAYKTAMGGEAFTLEDCELIDVAKKGP
jgi:hypothetical protein